MAGIQSPRDLIALIINNFITLADLIYRPLSRAIRYLSPIDKVIFDKWYNLLNLNNLPLKSH